MKPYKVKTGRRRKRNHKIKCLKCDQVFLSRNLKTNRLCYRCIASWKNISEFEPD